MEPKKTPKANIEKQKPLFIKIGVLLSLALVLFAFEWKSFTDSNEIISKNCGYTISNDVVIQTERPKPQEKQIIPKSTSTSIIEIVKKGGIDIFSFPEEDVDDTYDYPEEVANTNEDDIVDNVPLVFAEDMPEYPGGEKALFTYISTNIKYPRESIEINSSGTVYIKFIVEKDGRLSDVVVHRGVDVYCDKEALRVVSQMPNWKPGYQRGKAVRVQFVLPIKFQLNQ